MKHRFYWMIFAAGLLFSGCSYLKEPFQPSSAQLTETQPQLVTGCEKLTMINATADADRISTSLARREMVKRVKDRALQLGATHIVWLHQTDDSAAAQAYRCKAD